MSIFDPRRGLFAVGGYADMPLLDSFRNNLRQSAFRLRGYAPQQFYGSDFNLLNVEYRAPLWYADRGVSTLPIFLRSLAGAVFYLNDRLPADLKIDYVSDISCPWCAIGLASLEQALERLGGRKMLTCEKLGIDAKTLAKWLAAGDED